MTAASSVGIALIDGNFTGVLHAMASLSGLPSSAVTAIDAVAKGDIAGGAKSVMPVAIEALTPVLSDLVLSMNFDGVATLEMSTAEQRNLTSAAILIGTALGDGDFGKVIHAVGGIGGLPAKAITAIEKIVAGDIAAAARLCLQVGIDNVDTSNIPLTAGGTCPS